ncbi:putative hydrolase [Lepidopterella palustris CBS 459.81]|uniref:Putative hydrolase n=1 Tax=Lepidopterella palustris CBS 459.81 TaxID=1314670 RepID=A0A8E2E3W3_9PEZI|nr:putative hydrolase [Lepidopterella palustris CBS 459.81]
MPGLTDCCPSTLPPVQSNCTTTGRYINVAGIKTYTTGFATSNRIVLLIYDIFGPAAQTLQGADRLAASLSSTVLVPDLLLGNYAQKSWFDGEPSEEAKQQQKAFWELSEPTSMAKTVTKLIKSYEDEEGKRNDGKEWAWASLGLCWGGKVTALASAGPNTLFKVSGQGHPSRLAREDAEAITIPHIVLAAPSDNKEGGVDVYSEVSKCDGREWVVETYSGMFHGWMAARANLDDKDNAREFERAYDQIANFFAENFSLELEC